MFTLRCTRKLLRRLGTAPATEPAAPTTLLGDWYANLLFIRPVHLVLCVSERTLLPVLIPARPIAKLTTRFAGAVGDVLRRMGVPEAAVRAEERAMGAVAVGKTASRRVLGSMNDFTRMLDACLVEPTDLAGLSLHLAETPCGPLQGSSPDRMTAALFAGGLGAIH